MRSPTLAAAFGLLVVITATAGSAQPDWRGKVDGWVLDRAPGIGGVEYLVFLEAQADLSPAAALPSRLEKGRYVFETLRDQARRTQGPLLELLRDSGVEHRPYWVANMIWVKSGERTLRRIAGRSDVRHVYANPQVRLEEPVLTEPDPDVPTFGIETSITHTGAPDVFWANGFTGQGVVVAGQDTGYDWDHDGLKAKYRGWDGAIADHNYNWHDSIHSGGGACGADSPIPCDDNGHGTHTMGTMVGDDGAGNQVGMAPGARWIGCRNMDQGNGTPTTYSECFQWFIAPTDLNDENPEPALAPNVINNSWSCPISEGCTDPNVMLTVVENTRAAGILVSVSAGNSGQKCSTVSTPAAIYDASFTVGATDNSDVIASFSSRGPVTVDGSNRLKPDISAPGVSIRSTRNGGGYQTSSGTSMASPHVAGMAALVMSAGDCMIGDVDGLEQHMTDAALGQTAPFACGDETGGEIPNNTYGWGALRSQLPTSCAPAGGSASGMSPRRVSCRNVTSGEAVAMSLFGNDAWDCESAGLIVESGDVVRMLLRGKALNGFVGGAMTGLSGDSVTCRNADTGQSVSMALAGAISWSCGTGGLVASPGDRIQQIIVGTRN